MVIMKLTKTVLKNLLTKPVTRIIPRSTKNFGRTRGKVIIDIENCIFCGICKKKCPTGAINVTRATNKWEIDRFGCIQCSSCVENCPKKCLEMNEKYTLPESIKTIDVYNKAE